MSLVKKFSKLIPESSFKQGLRRIYHFDYGAKLGLKRANVGLIGLGESCERNGCLIGLDEHKYTLQFEDGILKGTKMYFPKTSFSWILPIAYELPSYFNGNDFFEDVKDAVVIDAGASPGDFCIAAAKKIRHGRVIALEPDEKNRLILEKTVRLNGLDKKIEILPYALSDQTKQAILVRNDAASYILDDSLNDSSKINKLNSYFNPFRKKIQTITLDCLLEQKALLRNRQNVFVKMDIEGSEINACLGARKAMEAKVNFAIAAYHKINGEESHIFLSDFFKKNNYVTSVNTKDHLVLFARPI